MYDPEGHLHDETGEPKYTNADKEVELEDRNQSRTFLYYLYRGGNVDPLPLKVVRFEADADHVYGYLRLAD